MVIRSKIKSPKISYLYNDQTGKSRMKTKKKFIENNVIDNINEE